MSVTKYQPLNDTGSEKDRMILPHSPQYCRGASMLSPLLSKPTSVIMLGKFEADPVSNFNELLVAECLVALSK